MSFAAFSGRMLFVPRADPLSPTLVVVASPGHFGAQICVAFSEAASSAHRLPHWTTDAHPQVQTYAHLQVLVAIAVIIGSHLLLLR